VQKDVAKFSHRRSILAQDLGGSKREEWTGFRATSEQFNHWLFEKLLPILLRLSVFCKLACFGKSQEEQCSLIKMRQMVVKLKSICDFIDILAMSVKHILAVSLAQKPIYSKQAIKRSVAYVGRNSDL